MIAAVTIYAGFAAAGFTVLTILAFLEHVSGNRDKARTWARAALVTLIWPAWAIVLIGALWKMASQSDTEVAH